MNSGESVKEQLRRVGLMSCGCEPWDLSDNDMLALRTVLLQRQELLAALKAITDVRVEKSAGKAIAMAEAAIAKAEGRS